MESLNPSWGNAFAAYERTRILDMHLQFVVEPDGKEIRKKTLGHNF